MRRPSPTASDTGSESPAPLRADQWPEALREVCRHAAELSERLQTWRRSLHQSPELSFAEVATTAWIAERLIELDQGWRVVPTGQPTGLLGELDASPGCDWPTVAIRADIDALPIEEAEGLPYRSRHRGVGHLCGHDAHTAMALGAAALLGAHRKAGRPTGKVQVVFQPAEEVHPGGAQPIVASGLLAPATAVAALHVFPDLPSGTVGLCAGPATAASDRFVITIEGRGGHGAGPEQCIDPIVAAAGIVSATQTIMSRGIEPGEPAVITFGQVQAGSAHNVIPQRAVLSGTIRSFRASTREMIHHRLAEIATGVAAAYQARASVEIRAGYPSVINDEKMVARMTAVAEIVLSSPLGSQAVGNSGPPAGVRRVPAWCASEDFAYYAAYRPSVMAFLGTAHPSAGSGAACHSPHFRVDENILPVGAALLAGFCLASWGGS